MHIAPYRTWTGVSCFGQRPPKTLSQVAPKRLDWRGLFETLSLGTLFAQRSKAIMQPLPRRLAVLVVVVVDG